MVAQVEEDATVTSTRTGILGSNLAPVIQTSHFSNIGGFVRPLFKEKTRAMLSNTSIISETRILMTYRYPVALECVAHLMQGSVSAVLHFRYKLTAFPKASVQRPISVHSTRPKTPWKTSGLLNRRAETALAAPTP